MLLSGQLGERQVRELCHLDGGCSLEGDGDPFFDFRCRSRHDGRSEQVEGSEDVFLAVFVEDAPGAALRLALDLGEVVKIGDFGLGVAHVYVFWYAMRYVMQQKARPADAVLLLSGIIGPRWPTHTEDLPKRRRFMWWFHQMWSVEHPDWLPSSVLTQDEAVEQQRTCGGGLAICHMFLLPRPFAFGKDLGPAAALVHNHSRVARLAFP